MYMSGDRNTTNRPPIWLAIPLLLVATAGLWLGAAVLKGLTEGTGGLGDQIGAKWAGNDKFAR
jgi:hypothetical protein